jgi:hypothetical protein
MVRAMAAIVRYRPARLRGFLRSESGISLVMALLVMVVLSISTGGVVTFVTSNQTNAGRDREAERAFNIAEAGLAKGADGVIAQDPNATVAIGTTLSPTSFSLDGGTGSWSATKASQLTWTVTATGNSPTGRVLRKLQEQVIATQQSGTTLVSPVYGYGFFMGDPNADCTVLSGGDRIGNSALVTVPVYIASSLCLTGGGAPLIANPASGPKITLYIGGKLQVDSNSDPVGTSSSRLTSATIVGGCQVNFHGWKNVICSTPGNPVNGTGSGVWASAYDATPQTKTKPVVDTAAADAVYQSAAPGPKHPCGAGSTLGPLRFDTNTTRDTSLGTVRLLKWTGGTTGNSFDCKFYDSGGNLTGQLSYTYGTPGALTINGTVFIDGNLSFSGNDTAVYSGKGTLYVDGTVSFSNGARLCGAPMVSGKCSGNWDPTQNALEIVAINHQIQASPPTPTGWNMGGDGEFEGIAYANGAYVSGNSAWVQGPVIADSGQLSGATLFKAITTPPPGAPGVTPSPPTTTWAIKRGSWQECPSAVATCTAPSS